MRYAFLLIMGLIAGGASRAEPPVGTVVIETPLGVVDNMRAPSIDNSPNAARLLNVGEMFHADNYPALAKDREVEGKVTVRVVVDPQGLATHCQTVGKPAPELGGPTCALFLAQARFDPARDRKGRAVKSTYTRTVAWMLEALVPLPFAEFHRTLHIQFQRRRLDRWLPARDQGDAASGGEGRGRRPLHVNGP